MVRSSSTFDSRDICTTMTGNLSKDKGSACDGVSGGYNSKWEGKDDEAEVEVHILLSRYLAGIVLQCKCKSSPPLVVE